jgi:hypothetical protein
MYLRDTSFWDVLLRGLKKMTTELTSIKFLLLAFTCVGIWKQFIGAETGLGMALLLVGLKEVPIDSIIAKLTGGIGK